MAYETYGPTPTVASSEVTVAAGIARVVGTGERIPYTPAADTPAGTIVVSNGRVGVTVSPISANVQDWLVVEGLFWFPKSASDTGMVFGGPLFYDSNSSLACSASLLAMAAASGSAANFTYLGCVGSAPADTDTRVLANLDNVATQGLLPIVNFTTSGTITSHASARYSLTRQGTLTLGAPTATTDDGKTVTFINNATYANVLSASGLILNGATGAALSTATALATSGAMIVLVAITVGSTGKWVVQSNSGFTLA